LKESWTFLAVLPAIGASRFAADRPSLAEPGEAAAGTRGDLARALAAVGAAFGVPAGADRDAPAPAEPYEAALAADAAGNEALAVRILLAAAREPGHEADGCLGLAVLGVRRELPAEARALAERCLALGVRHPRACAVLGVAAMEDGDAENAQTFLAAAARIARGEAAFLDDLKGAQRALLTMRLSGR
jgi:hypothetical protein